MLDYNRDVLALEERRERMLAEYSRTGDVNFMIEAEELQDTIRFIQAEDEQDYIYAVDMQKFNPDGSLYYY